MGAHRGAISCPGNTNGKHRRGDRESGGRHDERKRWEERDWKKDTEGVNKSIFIHLWTKGIKKQERNKEQK